MFGEEQENPGSAPPVEQKAPSGEGKRDEIAVMQRRIAELEQSERYWAQRAQAGAQPHAQPQAREEEEPAEDYSALAGDGPDTPEDEDPGKFAEDLGTRGIRALRERGLISEKRAREIAAEVGAKVARQIVGTRIERERQAMTTDARLQRDFPELADRESELFKRTADEMRQAAALDPRALKSPAALYQAARAAKLSLEMEARARHAEEPREQGGYYTPPSRRDERMEAQRPARSGGRAPAYGEEDDDYLGPEARQLIAAFGSYGVTEDGYRGQQKAMRDEARMGRRSR